MSGNNATRVPDWWAKLPPRHRMLVALGAATVILMGAAFLATSTKNPRPTAGNKPPDVTNLIVPKPADMTQEALAARVDSNNKKSESLSAEVKRITDEQIATRAALAKLETVVTQQQPALTTDVAKQVERLANRVESLEAGKRAEPKGTGPGLTDRLPIPGKDGATAPAQPNPAPAPAAPAMETVGGKSVVPKAQPTAADDDPTLLQQILLAGGFFEAVLINGMDAPTSSVTQKDPIPVSLRVKSDAVLPNQYEAPVSECFVTAYGYGVLATGRANMRTERLSCVLENGRPIQAKLDGYIVGEDGKVGLRGRVVSKQGQMIARSLLAGVFSGFGQAMTPTVVPQLSINPGGTQQTQMPNFDSAMQASASSGISSASRAAAQFYLDMAKEMFPVVEIDAGRRVTVMVKSGMDLTKSEGFQ